MRMWSLAAFAVLALVLGAFKENGMTLLIGVSSAAAAVAALPRWNLSTFLTLLCDLFAIETVLFGLGDLTALMGYWPKSLEEYQLPTYLPLATALFILAIFAVSHFRLVRRMMAIADPFFAARTPISIRPLPARPIILRQDLYARINVYFLILINQFQVALALRFNFFQRDFGNAIQVADEAHRVAFWYQLMVVFIPLATIAIVSGIVEFFIASNFVLQWRRWMTASFTSRWLMHSMHYKLALAATAARDPNQQPSEEFPDSHVPTDNPDQRISQDIGGFINGTGTGINSGNVGIYNYTIQAIASATNLVSFSIILWGISNSLNAPIFGLRIPGFLFWVAVLYACLATGITQLIGRSLSRLYFRQQAVEANFRFDLARIREYSEQIALLKGEEREIDRAGTVFSEVVRTVRRIIHVRTWLIAFNQFYSQISVIIPYVLVAPFYFAKLVDFGRFNQSADAFGNVNGAMNFFVDRYIGLADFRATIERLTSFEDAVSRTVAGEKRTPRVSAAPSQAPGLSLNDIDLAHCPTAASWLISTIWCWFPGSRRSSSDPRGSASRPSSAPSRACGRMGQARSISPPTPSSCFCRSGLTFRSDRYGRRSPIRRPAPTFTDQKLRETLTKVGLPALAARLDDNENWQMRLSGGEQQRLGRRARSYCQSRTGFS